MEKLEKLMQYIIGELVDNNSETRITYDIVDDTTFTAPFKWWGPDIFPIVKSSILPPSLKTQHLH